MREREGLIARIRQVRRVLAEPRDHERQPASGPGEEEVRALKTRVAHLEQLVEGLQDSVHRESRRLGRRVGDLETQIQPAELGKALDRDARERGL